MTRRFERPDGGRRLHTQTLCALSISTTTARDPRLRAALQAIEALGLDDAAGSQAFPSPRLQNWMAANCDGPHQEPLLPHGRTGHLVARSLRTTSRNFKPSRRVDYQHLMSVNGKSRH